MYEMQRPRPALQSGTPRWPGGSACVPFGRNRPGTRGSAACSRGRPRSMTGP